MNYPQILPEHHTTLFTQEDAFHDSPYGICAYYNIVPGADSFIGMHHHLDFYEINIVTQGHAMHYIGKNIIPAKKGDIFAIPPQLRHGFYPIGECKIFNLLISKSYVTKNEETFSKLSGFSYMFDIEPFLRSDTVPNSFPHFNHDARVYIFPLLDQISFISRNSYTNKEVLIASLVNYLLGEIVHFSRKTLSDTSTLSDTTRKILNSIEYINNNFAQNISFEALSEDMNMSYASFYNHFFKTCKMSPSQYLTNTRIQSAIKLLTRTDMTITDIALDCGFYDAAHLNRKFKLLNGCSPSDYRKKQLATSNL